MNLDLRFATEADAPAIIELVNAAYEVEKFFKVGERTDAAEIAELMKTGRFLLLEQGGKLIGSVYTELRGDRGYLGMLAVSPNHQRMGIGSRLIAAAEEFCREMGCRTMELTAVNLRTELPPLYERFGYRVTGSIPFPADTMPVKLACSLIVMSKPLGVSE